MRFVARQRVAAEVIALTETSKRVGGRRDRCFIAQNRLKPFDDKPMNAGNDARAVRGIRPRLHGWSVVTG
jgi:hypothetical protein